MAETGPKERTEVCISEISSEAVAGEVLFLFGGTKASGWS
jgi:hypothetical protein